MTIPSGLLQEQTAVVHCWRDQSSRTLKQDEHRDLCGSDHRSIIPYVHERCCIDVYVALFKVELNLVSSAVYSTFYRLRLGSYTMA
jgi:hypothetical protein